MESSLSAAFKDLRGDVGSFLGYGRGVDFGDATWTARQEGTIDRFVKGGLRKFYHCGYEWSFLKPSATLQLSTALSAVPMPDDFGSVDGRIVISTGANSNWCPVDLTGPGVLDMEQARNPSYTGWPRLGCLDPIKGTTATAGQRFQLRFYPTADADYTLRLRYNLNPDFLSGAFPYAYGGPQHAECLLAACKASAEIDGDDVLNGPQFVEFMRLLAISKELDQRQKAQSLGYNGDRSDALFGWADWRHDVQAGARVTFNGVQY